MSETLHAALLYASTGRPVFPLHTPDPTVAAGCSCRRLRCDERGKHPRTRNGLSDATTDLDRVARWWGAWPTANVGTVTGRASGVFVLDVDPHHGGDDTLRELERAHGALPPTVECITGGGGRHIYFRLPEHAIRNSVGLVGPGLDIRGEGGYVVAPPSQHAAGRRYEWSVDAHPEDVALAAAPGWLLSRVTAPTADRPIEPAETWVRMLRHGLPSGERNASLTRLVGHLFAKDVNALVVAEFAHLVNESRCKPPLDRKEVDRILESIATREIRKRRDRRR